jgi:hypothetical protein
MAARGMRKDFDCWARAWIAIPMESTSANTKYSFFIGMNLRRKVNKD